MPTARRSPTMADIARLAGVSPMTVSRAFRNDGSVTEATRHAVLSVAESLGYVLDASAANLRSGRTGFVAVTIPSINNANFADTLRGLTEGLNEQNLQILLGNTDYDLAREEELVEHLLRRRPEAIVVTGGTHTDRTRRLLAGAGIPVVETWDLPAAPIGHVVGFSNADAMAGLVDHVVAAGRRRIAFIGGDDARDSRGAERRQGVIAALARHGLPADRLIPAGPPPVSMREGARAMRQVLDRFPDTQAVLCVSDLIACGALSECQRRGLPVPDRLWIAGFGDYEIAEICVPGLTTVNPFAQAIGTRAAALVRAALAGDAPPPRHHPPRTVPARLHGGRGGVGGVRARVGCSWRGRRAICVIPQNM